MHRSGSTLPERDMKPAWHVLLPAGLVELGLLATLGWWPGGLSDLARIGVFAVAFVVYALAATRIKDAVGGAVLIWVFAVGMRLIFLPLAPELSADVYRYIWDGHVQLNGVNPFLHTPSDPALAMLRTPWFGLIEDPGSAALFPPFAQLAFMAIAMAGGTALQAKLLWLGADLGTAWLLGRVAAITGRSRRLTQMLYLWSPLLVVEVAWNGHMAPLALFGIVLVVLLGRAPFGAGVACGVSALSGLATVAAIPALTARLGKRFLVGVGATVLVFYLPYVRAGRGLLEGIFHHVEQHRFMEGPFLLIESAIPGSLLPRYVAAAVVLAVVIWLTIRRARPEKTLFWVLGVALLVAPVLRPWYALWILPLAALRVSRPWILFTGLSFLGYAGADAYRASGEWPAPLWARLLLWIPFLALLAKDNLDAWGREMLEPKLETD